MIRGLFSGGTLRDEALGGRGGRPAELSDFALLPPPADPPRIQEVHILFGHILCDLLEA